MGKLFPKWRNFAKSSHTACNGQVKHKHHRFEHCFELDLSVGLKYFSFLCFRIRRSKQQVEFQQNGVSEQVENWKIKANLLKTTNTRE